MGCSLPVCETGFATDDKWYLLQARNTGPRDPQRPAPCAPWQLLLPLPPPCPRPVPVLPFWPCSPALHAVPVLAPHPCLAHPCLAHPCLAHSAQATQAAERLAHVQRLVAEIRTAEGLVANTRRLLQAVRDRMVRGNSLCCR